MPNQTVFIPDTRPGMTASDRNMQLSAELANAPNNGRNIVKIARSSADSGWELTYQNS
jgi:hypothetical protein